MTMYREYEFQFNGFNFVSRVDVQGSMYQTIKTLPEGLFVEMNLQALNSLFANTPMTIESIKERLIEINENATQAFILLGDNN